MAFSDCFAQILNERAQARRLCSSSGLKFKMSCLGKIRVWNLTAAAMTTAVYSRIYCYGLL